MTMYLTTVAQYTLTYDLNKSETTVSFVPDVEALQLARRAVDLDPLNAGSWESLAETESYMGQLDQSAAEARRRLNWTPIIGAARSI